MDIIGNAKWTDLQRKAERFKEFSFDDQPIAKQELKNKCKNIIVNFDNEIKKDKWVNPNN